MMLCWCLQMVFVYQHLMMILPMISDWSVGWMEPHAPEFFNSDDEDADAGAVADNSFAVLVPCYRNDCKAFKMEERPVTSS
ncbi:hypothetical protein HanIR_Chr12g0600501 [Helianthus annuus]|nr:hypothetical protein HanIR_Chr12g0600501 [Helianthus annuus]